MYRLHYYRHYTGYAEDFETLEQAKKYAEHALNMDEMFPVCIIDTESDEAYLYSFFKDSQVRHSKWIPVDKREAERHIKK